MDRPIYLPIQPHPLISYVRVVKLLYASLVLFVLESYIYWVQLQKSVIDDFLAGIVFWAISFAFAFIHIFLVMMDGWSRYQDYKRAKDLFFEHGVQDRIAKRFVRSKCQRMAAMVAAAELGLASELKHFYKKAGIRWQHFIPYFVISEPLFLFRSVFWSRTFMEKYYHPKFNFQNLQLTTFP